MTAPLRQSFLEENENEVISSLSAAPGDRLPVLGLDPGYKHGCKWAACDPYGSVLATGVVWPLQLRKNVKVEKLEESQSNNVQRNNKQTFRKTNSEDPIEKLLTIMKQHK